MQTHLHTHRHTQTYAHIRTHIDKDITRRHTPTYTTTRAQKHAQTGTHTQIPPPHLAALALPEHGGLGLPLGLTGEGGTATLRHDLVPRTHHELGRLCDHMTGRHVNEGPQGWGATVT